VRAVDAAGNVDPTPASFSWAVLPPIDTSITSGPSGLTASTSATFAFSSTYMNVTYECSLDGAAFVACANPVTFAPLAQGAHSLRVRAVAMTAEIDTTPAMAAWTIDTLSPMAPVITYPADGSTIGTTTVDVTGTSEPNSA